MYADKRELGASDPAPQAGRGKATLELLFISFFGLVVLAAFISALRYDFVSARAPLCIIAPMLILIGIQFNRARKAVRMGVVKSEIAAAVAGHRPLFNASLSLTGWMLLLLVAIYVAGHYAGMTIFVFLLLRFVAREPIRLSIAVTAGVTLCIYLLFEHLFNIELYKGALMNAILARIG